MNQLKSLSSFRMTQRQADLLRSMPLARASFASAPGKVQQNRAGAVSFDGSAPSGFAAWNRSISVPSARDTRVARNNVISLLVARNAELRARAAEPSEDPFRDLKGIELVRAIRKHALANRKSVTYSETRKILFGKVDNLNGEVECIYTGRKIRVNGEPPDDKDMNVEHVRPQSDGVDGANKADMNNLQISDSKFNSDRGSRPYGIVVKVEREEGGSKIGLDADGNEVCEPRAGVRGRIARNMMYSIVFGLMVEPKEEAVIRQWAKDEPPSADELARAERIQAEQGNINPFVKWPQLVERIMDL